MCIPSKTSVVREDDKPWYDSEIRRNSRKRDRLKKTALKSGNQNGWKNTNTTNNKKSNNDECVATCHRNAYSAFHQI